MISIFNTVLISQRLGHTEPERHAKSTPPSLLGVNIFSCATVLLIIHFWLNNGQTEYLWADAVNEAFTKTTRFTWIFFFISSISSSTTMRCSVLLNFKQIPVICPFCICLFFSFASNAVLLFTIRRSSDFSFDLTNSCSVCGMKDWLKHRHYYKKCDVLVLHFLMLKIMKYVVFMYPVMFSTAPVKPSWAEKAQAADRRKEGWRRDVFVTLKSD